MVPIDTLSSEHLCCHMSVCVCMHVCVCGGGGVVGWGVDVCICAWPCV